MAPTSHCSILIEPPPPPLAGFASQGKDLDRSNGLINFTFDQLRLYQKRQEGTNTCHIKASLITVINLSTGTFGTYFGLVAQNRKSL